MSANDLPFQDGEIINLDIRYKYGLVMAKGGTAQYKINESTYNGESTYKTTLYFKTNSFFDKIFKVRDTLTTHISLKAEPLYYDRRIREGGTQFTEETIFKSFGENYSEARIIRKNDEGEIRLDTIHTVKNEAFDFLSILTHLRTWNFSNIPIGESKDISIFSGKKNVNIKVRFLGQSILEKSERLKYKTYKVELDIVDDVFNESKTAIEAWFSDDENKIPLKIKAKLKIGAMEVDISSYSGLKYPLSSEIEIPR